MAEVDVRVGYELRTVAVAVFRVHTRPTVSVMNRVLPSLLTASAAGTAATVLAARAARVVVSKTVTLPSAELTYNFLLSGLTAKLVGALAKLAIVVTVLEVYPNTATVPPPLALLLIT